MFGVSYNEIWETAVFIATLTKFRSNCVRCQLQRNLGNSCVQCHYNKILEQLRSVPAITKFGKYLYTVKISRILGNNEIFYSSGPNNVFNLLSIRSVVI